MNTFAKPLQSQRGVVLIVALIMLLTMTIVSVGAMSTSTLEQKMTANLRDRQVAFQAAEAALREGERFAESHALQESDFNATCTGGSGGQCLCTKTTPSPCPEYWTDSTLNVWETSGRYKSYTNTQLGDAPAKYIVEYRGNICIGGVPCTATTSDPQMFRITAVGYGQTTGAKVMLQSTYMKE
jgi:type IV pilus assembly protein PilX